MASTPNAVVTAMPAPVTEHSRSLQPKTRPAPIYLCFTGPNQGAGIICEGPGITVSDLEKAMNRVQREIKGVKGWKGFKPEFYITFRDRIICRDEAEERKSLPTPYPEV